MSGARSLPRVLFAGLCALAAAACGSETPGSSGGAGGTTSGAAAGSAGAPFSGGAGGSAGATYAGGAAGAAGGGAAGGGGGGTGGVGSAGGGAAGGGAAGGGAAGGGAAGGAGAAGSAGSGGGSSFAPCPSSGACKILPLGDSITDGFGTPGGYRIDLFELAVGAGKEITFVGGAMNGPEMVADQPFPRSHEGHSGWTVQQIDDIVPDPALGVDPDIILLHIGTNDMFGDAGAAVGRLETLLDQLLDGAPDALLAVAQIIPFPGQSSNVSTYNAGIPALVQERADAGKHIILVDQFTGFQQSELADGVHPNPQGYSRMADTWYAAISSYLP